VYDLQCKQGLNLYDVTMQTETLLCMIYNASRDLTVYDVTMQTETLLCMIYNANRDIICMMFQYKRRLCSV
jgi:hypothetical protein